MSQLCFFDSDGEGKANQWRLYIDGASRNNPGPSGAGIVIFKQDVMLASQGFYLGRKTNNQAEYLALLLGVHVVKQMMPKGDQLTIISDSELMVKQLNGQYKVRDSQLKQFFLLAKDMLQDVPCRVKHVLRSENKDADNMANVGVDKKIPIPNDFLELLAARDMAW